MPAVHVKAGGRYKELQRGNVNPTKKMIDPELIVKKRENDMLKAAIVLVVLLFIMVLVIIVRAIRVHKIKKSMEIDTRKSNLDNDFYENIESNKY